MCPKSKYTYYAIYIILVLILNLLYIAPPFLASAGNSNGANTLYMVAAPFCHQLPQRSLCLIAAGDGSRSIGDCVQADTEKINKYTYSDSRGIAYEFGVCSRDMAIYLAMLVGGLAYSFVRRVDDENTLPIWLFLLALVPIAIDGGGQFIGLWESTNFMRLLTGAIAGFAVPFYAIPLMYFFFNRLRKDR